MFEKETTLIMIKPDAVRSNYSGKILARIEELREIAVMIRLRELG